MIAPIIILVCLLLFFGYVWWSDSNRIFIDCKCNVCGKIFKGLTEIKVCGKCLRKCNKV